MYDSHLRPQKKNRRLSRDSINIYAHTYSQPSDQKWIARHEALRNMGISTQHRNYVHCLLIQKVAKYVKKTKLGWDCKYQIEATIHGVILGLGGSMNQTRSVRQIVPEKWLFSETNLTTHLALLGLRPTCKLILNKTQHQRIMLLKACYESIENKGLFFLIVFVSFQCNV